ncbi:hypothetical protein [Bradyrhizobium sp. CCBAU 51627]|uniref:hypothetical protein n=1 Tax=Bradyrhizobium sp. CCBAU 51627 TaxID=1325088 RepID=UPI002306A6B6|nr:hypothetical protein [Bradyrhizobium sp. CCBAU 51627]
MHSSLVFCKTFFIVAVQSTLQEPYKCGNGSCFGQTNAQTSPLEHTSLDRAHNSGQFRTQHAFLMIFHAACSKPRQLTGTRIGTPTDRAFAGSRTRLATPPSAGEPTAGDRVDAFLPRKAVTLEITGRDAATGNKTSRVLV